LAQAIPEIAEDLRRQKETQDHVDDHADGER